VCVAAGIGVVAVNDGRHGEGGLGIGVLVLGATACFDTTVEDGTGRLNMRVSSPLWPDALRIGFILNVASFRKILKHSWKDVPG
jgi:hypothetical protein